jgi:hypothetical protein
MDMTKPTTARIAGTLTTPPLRADRIRRLIADGEIQYLDVAPSGAKIRRKLVRPIDLQAWLDGRWQVNGAAAKAPSKAGTVRVSSRTARRLAAIDARQQAEVGTH